MQTPPKMQTKVKLCQIIAYMQVNDYMPWNHFSIDDLKKLVLWYHRKDLLGMVIRNHLIIGIVFIRWIAKPNDILEPYKHNPKGQWVAIDYMIGKNIRQDLASVMIDRLPDNMMGIVYTRGIYGSNTVKTIPLKKINKLIKHHGK